jgi:hypothetical protein
MFNKAFARYQRNEDFKKNLPAYRHALRIWMWRDKKKMTTDVFIRWQIVRELETDIIKWGTAGWLARFFIEPPEKDIKKVLSWP